VCARARAKGWGVGAARTRCCLRRLTVRTMHAHSAVHAAHAAVGSQRPPLDFGCPARRRRPRRQAVVEQKYAKEMGKWSERWKAKCNAMTVDSTLADAWKAFVQAGEKLTELHGDVKVTIEAELVPEIQEFKKARFPKGFGGFKAAKQASKEFDAAQKPWEKRKAKIQKARAQVLTKEAVIEEMRQGSSSAKAINKKEAELLRLRGGMGTRIAEIYEYRATYETQVGSTFTRLQDEERERVTFFKDIFARYGRPPPVPPPPCTQLKRV